jgi:hypothetical protein
MKKTMSINIAGQLFRIDEDAFEILTRYLEHVSDRLKSEQGGEETISDIETRIAEIFGGGSEPPLLVSREMVDNMINIMGAPEEYNAESAATQGGAAGPRKPLYDPDSLPARAGKTLSVLARAFRKVMSAVLRVLAVTLGALFTIFGFILLFTFGLLFFFHNAPFVKTLIEPDIQNMQMLLSIAIGSNLVQTVFILSALVILIPLAALTYLGIKLIFKIGASSKLFRVIVFVTWIAAMCALCVILTLRLSIYANHDSIEEKVKLDSPPRTLWIAPLKKVAEIGYDEKAAVDLSTFWRKSSTGQLFCTPELSIYGSDTTSAWISVERRAYSKSYTQASKNARMIDYTWKFSRDTLYLDEYFKLPEGSPWNGSTLNIDISLPEGTLIKPVPGANLSTWLFRVRDHAATMFRIKEGDVEEITK